MPDSYYDKTIFVIQVHVSKEEKNHSSRSKGCRENDSPILGKSANKHTQSNDGMLPLHWWNCVTQISKNG